MQRVQALLFSKAGRATSAACFICGFAWIYAKRKINGKSDLSSLSLWLPTSRWFWKTNDDKPQLFDHLETMLQALTFKDPGTSNSERQQRAMTKHILQALQRFVLLTKDPALCDDLLSSPALGALIRLTAERGQLFDHVILRQIAELFANLSPRPGAAAVFSRNGFDQVISAWLQRTDCAHLSLCAAKLRENLQSSGLLAVGLYPLTPPGKSASEQVVDVVFVNGINGSVFHTWRQRDELAEVDANYTKCWPRDWLSEDFPTARILGVDVKVRAWSWNPATSDRDSERTLAWRSARLLKDLEQARVGRDGRSVIWVAHSMGGLLVKELLRQAEAENSKLVEATRGVLFLSTPHRGGRSSLRALFHFPLRLALSLESLELGHEYPPLIDLDKWFRERAQSLGWRVLNCAEGLPTYVNPLYSVRLVELPGEDPSNEILIPTDHIDISKPRDRHDLIYGTVKSFLSDCLP